MTQFKDDPMKIYSTARASGKEIEGFRPSFLQARNPEIGFL
jgi:hypothetical protein